MCVCCQFVMFAFCSLSKKLEKSIFSITRGDRDKEEVLFFNNANYQLEVDESKKCFLLLAIITLQDSLNLCSFTPVLYM